MRGAEATADPGTIQNGLTPERLAENIETYLSDHAAAAVLEDGRVVFDMRMARYAVGAQHGRCLLQLWSDERNLVRTVLAAEERAHCLRLTTRRMGAVKPTSLGTGSHQRPAHSIHSRHAGAEISEKPPRLLLAAPALRIHPANEIVLRYFSPGVEWELMAVGEHWRQELKVVFRRRGGRVLS